MNKAPLLGVALTLAAAVVFVPTQAVSLPYDSEKILVRDSLGRRVALPAKVERVLSLEPEITRLITALGMGGSLVGIDYFLLHHDHLFPLVFPQAMKLPPVSNAGNDLNLEAAFLLRPDVVVVSPSEVSDPDSLGLKLGVPVLVLSSAGRFEELMREIELLGEVLRRVEQASELLAFVRSELAELEKTTSRKSVKKPGVYLTFWGSLTRTPVRYDPVAAAGGLNLAGSLPPAVHGASGTTVQVEQVIAWNPEVILVHGAYLPEERTVTPETVMSDRRLASVSAVREGRVFYTFGFWYWWDPALVLVETRYLAWRLHPELYPGFDLMAEGERIFRRVYGSGEAFGILAGKLGCREWIKHEK